MTKTAIGSLLLVEDNPGDARLLLEMLRESGLDNTESTHVASMKEAGKHLAEHAVDIILIDLGLPDAQGLEAVRQARAVAPRAPLVVLTGLDDEGLAAQALQEGAQDYLIKGEIDARILLRALRYAVERNIMEEALFAEKERAQVTLNCIGDAVACTDNAGNLTFLNLVAENLTGWSRRDAAGRPMADVFRIVNTFNRQVIPNPMEMALGRDRTLHLPPDSILIRRDGFEIPIEDSVAPIHDRDKRATGAVIVLRDVSASRAMSLRMLDAAADVDRQNTLLGRVNDELTALLRSSPIAIYATDLEGVVTMWNPAAERLSGFSREEAMGRFVPFVPEDEIEDSKKHIRRIFEGEPASNLVMARRRKDGAMIELSISVGPLTDESGVARGLICLAENVTEAVSERKKIARMQSEFVSTVSHELRTPLTSIGGSLGLIAGGAAGVINDRAARLIEIANSNTQRLIRLVNDILDIERLQSGRVAFHFASIGIDEIVAQAISANLAYAATFGIELRRVGEGPGILIDADPDRVNQAVTNLISNAVKFSPAGESVEISAVRTADGVRISVEDRGPGIPEELRPRIFERFAQGDSSDRRQKGGSGLGLSIVREIMNRHGGSVCFDSPPGEGARFHLDFPVAARMDRQPLRARSDRPTSGVLVCGLSAAIVDPVRETWLAHGLKCAVVSAEDHAVLQVANGPVEVVVIDLSFAAENLGDFIRRLRACRGAEQPAVAIVCVEPAISDPFYVSQALPMMGWIRGLAEVGAIPRATRNVVEPSPLRKFAVLHVDADRDVLEVVREALRDDFDVVSAQTLETARHRLERDRFDLVILDFTLSLGLVEDVVAAFVDATDLPIPIVLLTTPDATAKATSSLETSPIPSPGGIATLVEAVRSAFAETARDVHKAEETQHATQSALC